MQQIDLNDDKKRQDEEIQFLFFIIKKILEAAIVLGIKFLRFCLYVFIFMLKMFVRAVEALFLQDYKPFSRFQINKKNNLNKKAKTEFEKQFAIEFLTKHTYRFEKSDLYKKIYREIVTQYKDFAKNNVTIDEVAYQDLVDKINILTVESEKKGLQEGYSYAARTKYKLRDEEIYNSYIEDQVMRGEGRSEIDKEYGTCEN